VTRRDASVRSSRIARTVEPLSNGDGSRKRGCVAVALPLEDGKSKKDWRPGTDTVQDIRPGSALSRKYEDRQRKPDDLKAQGQRTIAVHALENLATSDTGITMLRRTARDEQYPMREPEAEDSGVTPVSGTRPDGVSRDKLDAQLGRGRDHRQSAVGILSMEMSDFLKISALAS
jgi:hypothetical protein